MRSSPATSSTSSASTAASIASCAGSLVLTKGLVDWLLACPEKGYFVPIESESTDTL
jgi:hypothetical protein